MTRLQLIIEVAANEIKHLIADGPKSASELVEGVQQSFSFILPETVQEAAWRLIERDEAYLNSDLKLQAI